MEGKALSAHSDSPLAPFLLAHSSSSRFPLFPWQRAPFSPLRLIARLHHPSLSFFLSPPVKAGDGGARLWRGQGGGGGEPDQRAAAGDFHHLRYGRAHTCTRHAHDTHTTHAYSTCTAYTGVTQWQQHDFSVYFWMHSFRAETVRRLINQLIVWKLICNNFDNRSNHLPKITGSSICSGSDVDIDVDFCVPTTHRDNNLDNNWSCIDENAADGRHEPDCNLVIMGDCALSKPVD